MNNVRKFIPKNVIPMFEALEPIIKFDFEIEVIDETKSEPHNGQCNPLDD